MKKVLSVVLSVLLLVSAMSICANAAQTSTYNGYASISIDRNNTFNPDNFDITLSIDDNKLGALDGESTEFTYTIDSIQTSSGSDYYSNPEEFFAIFTAEDFNGASINVNFTVNFLTDAIFGELNYRITIKGFSAPLDLGIDLGGLGGLLGGETEIDTSTNIPTDIVYTGTLSGVPTIDQSAIEILGRPDKTDYYDSEKFDPNGTKFELTLSNGTTGTFTYNEENAHMFSFNPNTKEQLSCYDSEVAMFLSGVYVMTTPITVQHKWSTDANGEEAYVNITTYKFTPSNPGYHAIVCEGCGEARDAQKHVPQGTWTYNNDQTFISNGTASNTCKDCGTVLVYDVLGTADFNTAFEDFHFIKVIFEYINVLLRFIGAATY